MDKEGRVLIKGKRGFYKMGLNSDQVGKGLGECQYYGGEVMVITAHRVLTFTTDSSSKGRITRSAGEAT